MPRTIVTGVIGADTHIVGNRILSMALEKAGSGDPFYVVKLHTARFYFAKLLPETAGLIRSARAGCAPLMAMDAELF